MMLDATDSMTRPTEPPAFIGGALPENAQACPADDPATTMGAITYTQTRVLNVDKKVWLDNRMVGSNEPGPISDAYKIMCVQVLQYLREHDGNALAVVSPGKGEGKTLTAINLALSLAQEVDKTVLLVDANLRFPAVHKYFGFTPQAGLSDYLLSNAPIDKMMVNPGVDHLVILPGGRPIANSAEILGSQKMLRLVQELKDRYPSRIVVFDLPPVLSVADAIAFSPYVDAAIMVVREHQTRREDLQRATTMLSSIALIGTVLNCATESALVAPPLNKWQWLRRLFAWRRAAA